MSYVIIDNTPIGKMYYCGNGSAPYHDWKLEKSDALIFNKKRNADKLIKYYKKRELWVSETIKMEGI